MELKRSRIREGGKPKRRRERTAQMMLVVIFKVTVPKLALIPGQSSSEHGKRKLPLLRAGAWLG